jgi:Calcineurin-like phosphoesterase
LKHAVIPDIQAKDGIDFTYLYKIGTYLVEKKPDKIICLGDFADMPSLSSYDQGKKSFEGRRYTKDIKASQDAMCALLNPLWEFNEKAKRNKEKQYKPELILTLGNHENRINRAINDDPKLEGLISVSDLCYEQYGWQVVPFLDVLVVDGIAYSHYFTTGLMGRPVTTAGACLAKKHMSCIQGHQQGLQISTAYKADGTRLTSVIAGSCYEHNEDYMSSQGNKHWRGFLMLHDVKDGEFDLMSVSLEYINKRYAN